MKTRRLLVYVLAAIVVGSVLFGIWKFSSEPVPGPSPQAVKIRVGFIPITDCGQLYVAKDLGIFERYGLDVELVPMAGGAAILEALSSGSVDIGFANLASAVFYEERVGKLQRLAGGTFMNAQYSEAGLVVLNDSRIRNLTDLRGKTIAVNSVRNIVDLAVLRALRNQGIRSSEVRLVEMPFPNMEAALRAKKIDAAALPEPLLTKAMAGGGLTNLGDHFVLAFGEMYSTAYFTSESRFSSRSDAFERFNQAMTEATPTTNGFNGKVLDAVSRYTK
ncbi:MAG: ABC transporter substrate-binding protein, partial [Candidatus Binatia bacterium]